MGSINKRGRRTDLLLVVTFFVMAGLALFPPWNIFGRTSYHFLASSVPPFKGQIDYLRLFVEEFAAGCLAAGLFFGLSLLDRNSPR